MVTFGSEGLSDMNCKEIVNWLFPLKLKQINSWSHGFLLILLSDIITLSVYMYHSISIEPQCITDITIWEFKITKPRFLESFEELNLHPQKRQANLIFFVWMKKGSNIDNSFIFNWRVLLTLMPFQIRLFQCYLLKYYQESQKKLLWALKSANLSSFASKRRKSDWKRFGSVFLRRSYTSQAKFQSLILTVLIYFLDAVRDILIFIFSLVLFTLK